jgi:hypothetical protein
MCRHHVSRHDPVMTTIDKSQRTAARVAGFLLLFLMAAGFFSQIYVPSRVIVDGDAVATAHNIMESERLFRISIASDILIFACDILVAVAFYVVLRRVSPWLTMLAMLWRAAQATIMVMGTISFLAVALIVSGPGELRGFSTDQLQALASTYIGVHTAGFNVGIIFLGLGGAVFSYVWFKSSYIPRALAALGMFAYIVMTAFTLAIIVFPGAEDAAAVAAGRFVPAFFFEVIMGAWLLFKGVRAPVAAEAANAPG